MSSKYQTPKDISTATAKETNGTLKNKSTNAKTKKPISPTLATGRVSQNTTQSPSTSVVRQGSRNTTPKTSVVRPSQNTPPKRPDDALNTSPKSYFRRESHGTPPNGSKRGTQNTPPKSTTQLTKIKGKKINGPTASASNTPKSTKVTNAKPLRSNTGIQRESDRVLKCKHLLQIIFLYVDPDNIGKCSMVCKQWNACLSRKEQNFWYKWAQCHFDVGTGQLTGCLDDWSHSCRFLQKQTNTTKKRTVFKSEPSRWNCGVIVPNTFVPYGFDPNPNIDYMTLSTAVHKLTVLLRKSQLVDAKCVADGNGQDSDIEVVLLPWKGKKIPKAMDVLNMMHVTDDVIKSASEVEVIHIDPSEPDDLEENFLVEDIEERDDYYEWLAKMFKTSYSFQAGEDLLSHRMYFFLTRINSEYIGGLIAATT